MTEINSGGGDFRVTAQTGLFARLQFELEPPHPATPPLFPSHVTEETPLPL